MSGELKILILDDDIDLAQSLAEILETEGHKITLVHDGITAIEAFKANDYDVAFFDVRMPGMNGVESFIEIKKIKPDARVFMMTGYSVDQLLEQALENGALGVLRKPFDINQLIEKLDGIKEGLVVVADNDPNFIDVIVPALEDDGYNVLVARTGIEALKVVNNNVSFLILDLDLPILSGVEVYLEMKKRGIQVPTILVTARRDGQSQDIVDLCRREVSGFFRKPFDIKEVIKIIHETQEHVT